LLVGCSRDVAGGKASADPHSRLAAPNPRFFQRAEPALANRSGFVAIGAGDEHACALAGDGRVACWGGNILGQAIPRSPETGKDPGRERLRPTWVPEVEGAIDLSVSGAHTCVVTGRGELLCWGGNVTGSMGGDASLSTFGVSRRFGRDFTHVHARNGGTCGLTKGAAPRCVGGAENGRMLRDDVPSTSHGGPYYSELRPMVGLSPPMQLALGGRHACALSDDGEVSCWGLNNLGQLGLARASAETPTRVDGLSQIVAISTAYFTTCALDEAGAVFCWGEGTEGQLAVDPRELHGSMDKRTRAKAERVLGIGPAKEISVGGLSVCIREADDGVSCWGSRRRDTGWGAHPWMPGRVDGLTDAVAISLSTTISDAFVCALTKDGRVRCAGANDAGQLGDGGESRGGVVEVDVSEVR
jgi:alpha-tubulin suppressor-like RCC1 family protein